jgi:hypothetical protein
MLETCNANHYNGQRQETKAEQRQRCGGVPLRDSSSRTGAYCCDDEQNRVVHGETCEGMGLVGGLLLGGRQRINQGQELRLDAAALRLAIVATHGGVSRKVIFIRQNHGNGRSDGSRMAARLRVHSGIGGAKFSRSGDDHVWCCGGVVLPGATPAGLFSP